MVHSDAAGGEKRGSADVQPDRGEVAPVVDPLALSLSTAAGGAPAQAEASLPSLGAAVPRGEALDAVLAAEVLQRVAWGGDRRRGVARLELGGELSGVIVVVRGEGREVALELSLPAGRHAEELPERLRARLAARGLVVREVVVR